MKTVLKTIFIINFLMLPALTNLAPPLLALPNNYFVTQNGGGERNGESQANSWSVADFNALNGNIYAGATFYFSGTITSTIDVNISGNSGNYVTIDGYQTNNTTYMHLSEAPGRTKINTKFRGKGINIDGVEYIIVQDFEFNNCRGASIQILGTSRDILFKRNFIDGGAGMISAGSSYNITIGGSAGHGNVVKNIGTGTADEDIALTGTHDIIISYNHLYADNSSFGIDGIMVDGGVTNVLIEYNSIHGHERDGDGNTHGEDGIDLKKTNSNNFIIRYNHIYDHNYQTCITIQSGVDNVYVYGNRCSNAENGIVAGDSDVTDNIFIFSNVLYDMERHGIHVGFQGRAGDVWVYNNTLAENGTCTQQNGIGYCESFNSNTSWGNIAAASATSLEIKNNILYKSRPNDTSYRQLYVSKRMDTITVLENNKFYWPSKTSTIYWGDEGYTNLERVQSGGIGNGLSIKAAGLEGDPGLTNMANNVYTIAPGAEVIDAGVDMGSGDIATVIIQGIAYPVYWDAAIGPNTDWSEGSIPVVEVMRRDIVGWDIGAYAYGNGHHAAPQTISPPSALRIIAN